MIRTRKIDEKRSGCRGVSDQNQLNSLLFPLLFSLVFRESDMHRFQNGHQAMEAKHMKKPAANAAGDG